MAASAAKHFTLTPSSDVAAEATCKALDFVADATVSFWNSAPPNLRDSSRPVALSGARFLPFLAVLGDPTAMRDSDSGLKVGKV